ncbi:uncharacterized protein KY384_003648 [Bacidia gigantensis]|uniref:uncharacterized protein n=1 Tax=Bacidia gigantensis TaxID=2732470 RepID=UPI001D044A93|nr:uncharacterized protein KY384_003648 [Bacidia gigantensis]KAG8532012.1 hypothetical protein KY384_003648 [Bacidia gigantensis]
MSEAEDWSMTESYAQLKVSLLIALLVLACSASVVIVNRKGSLGASASPSKDSFIIPYWLPYFGHFFHLWYNWQGFFRRAKMTSAVQSLVTIQVLGQRCAIILKPDLSKKVFERQASSLNQNTLHWHMLANVYGADAKLWESFMKVNQAPSYYGNEELASDLTLRINASLESHLPDLVSFSESAIDQYEWERLANATLTEQTYGMRLRPAVEIDLLALLRSFTGAIHLTSLVGSDFSDTCPSALKDISDFEHGWKYLLIRVSPWLPIPPLTKAYIARRTLTKVISSFYDALHAEASSEPLPSQWRDLSDVSPVVKARSAFWRNQGVPKSLRVAADLEFIWE